MSARAGIAIIGGTGRFGRALALRWARAGRRVLLGSRAPEKAIAIAATLSAGLESTGGALIGAANVEAAGEAALVVITVPYAHHEPTLRSIAEASRGALVLDCTVPLHPGPRVEARRGPSAAAEARALLGPGARLVAGLHTNSHLALADPEADPGDALFCGDAPADRDEAATWLADLGLRPVDVGPLHHAAALERMVAAIIDVNQRLGSHAGVRLTGLPRPAAGAR